jgi:2,4-dienoyl-CoA reductase-like NADH-dependent reductase (Old Yellow Enzyme family)
MAAFSGESSTPKELDELTMRFERGDFDLVAVGRAILQDPLWVLKIKEGRKNELETFTAGSLAKYY